jgi:DNA-binding transcriptional ArsR family regulator
VVQPAAARLGSVQQQAEPVDRVFAALSDPTRRAVVGLLKERPHRAGELAGALAVGPAALSRHLRILRKAELIMDEHPDHDARVRLYSLRPQAFATLRDWLNEVEAFWATQLSAFRDHVERDA